MGKFSTNKKKIKGHPIPAPTSLPKTGNSGAIPDRPAGNPNPFITAFIVPSRKIATTHGAFGQFSEGARAWPLAQNFGQLTIKAGGNKWTNRPGARSFLMQLPGRESTTMSNKCSPRGMGNLRAGVILHSQLGRAAGARSLRQRLCSRCGVENDDSRHLSAGAQCHCT